MERKEAAEDSHGSVGEAGEPRPRGRGQPRQHQLESQVHPLGQGIGGTEDPEPDHQDALHQMEKAHDRIKAPQAQEGFFRCMDHVR